MSRIKFYPPYGIIPIEEKTWIDMEADTVRDVIGKARKRFGRELFDKKSLGCTIFVNGRSISYLQRFKTKLSDGDVVRMVNNGAGR